LVIINTVSVTLRLNHTKYHTPCTSSAQLLYRMFANPSSREVLLGITGKDFTLIAASKAAMRGATILKASDDKTRSLNSHTLMAFSGEAGDTGTQYPSQRRHAYPTHLD
jgi:20S proteasome alpha/beta subunit